MADNHESNVTIYGTSGNDSLYSPYYATWTTTHTGKYSNGNTYTYTQSHYNYTSNVTYYGRSGNDTVNIGSMYSKVYGEDGNDYIFGDTGGSTLDGGNGKDTISVSGSSDNIIGGAGDDCISAGGVTNIITGGTGDDRISTNGTCKSHSTINYTDGDGKDVITSWSHNDTIQLGASTAVSSSKLNGKNLTFNIGTGSITFNSADHKYINIRNSSGTIDSYILNGKNTVKAANNFTEKATLNDTNKTSFLYNAGKFTGVYPNNDGKNDFIYNEDRAKFTTINAGTGNDTIDDHSADSMIIYKPGEGNDSITFDDTTDVSGWDNITHYYGGGLFAITEGTYSGYSYANGVNKFKVGSNNLTINSTCFTIREVDSNKEAGFKYTRYWDKNWPDTTVRKFNSFVYHNNRFYEDANVGTYDDENSANYYKENLKVENKPENDEADYIYTNFGTNADIDGGGGEDWIYNYGATQSTITGGKGKDTIHNIHGSYTDSVTVDGGEDDDYIFNNSSKVSIFGGTTGKDTIYNGGLSSYHSQWFTGGSSVTVDAGIDDDYVYNYYGHYASIAAGEGDDTIHNEYGSYITVEAGKGNDSIYNYYGSHASIIADGEDDEGNDTIRNYYYSSYATVEAGKGNDSIYNGYYSHYSLLNSGEGDDTVYNYNSSYVTVEAGKGNDSIYNYYGSYASIIAGEGDDTVYSYSGSLVTIDGGLGNDSINNTGSSASIIGGKGEDTIYNYGSSSKIDGGDDKDYIYNTGSYSSIASGEGDDTIYNTGSQITIDGGDGSDNINNQSYTGPAVIKGGSGDNYINNNAYLSTITAGTGNDTIYNNSTSTALLSGYDGTRISVEGGHNYINNKAVKSSITSGAGNDTIINQSASGPAYIYAGAGDNSIKNYSSNSTIITGENNDTIYNMSEHGPVTIKAGDGDNYIYNNSSKSTITSGSGKDTIYNNSTLGPVSIDSGGDDDIIYIQHANKNTITGGTGNDIVTLSSTDHNNMIIFNPGDGQDTVYGWEKMHRDLKEDFSITGGVTYSTQKGDFGGGEKLDLRVDVNDGSGGYILFIDVLDPPITADVLRATQINDLIMKPDNVSVKNTKQKGKEVRYTIDLADYIDTLPAVYNADLTKDEVVAIGTIVGSHYDETGVETIGINTKYQEVKTLLLEENINTATRTTNVQIIGNNSDNFIVGGKGNDLISGDEGSDTLEGGAGKDTLTGNSGADMFVARAYSPKIPIYKKSHVNENTITDYSEVDIVRVASGYIDHGEIKKDGTVRLLIKNHGTNFNQSTVNILKGEKQNISIIDEYGNFSRQLYGANSIKIANGDGTTINTLWNPTAVTIDSSERHTSVGLVGNAKNNLILSGIGNNTLTTGSGNDTVVYYGGRDVITDYTEKKDIIQLKSDQYIDALDTVQGSSSTAIDAIYTFNDGGSIRINEAVSVVHSKNKTTYKKKTIKLIGDNGYTLQGSGSDLTLVVNDSYVSKNGTEINNWEISPAINVLNASSVNKKYALNLNSNGMIKAGKGNDTLTGGSGDDTLTGGAGKDVFVYTWGNDVITDYAAGESILLDANQELVSYQVKAKTKHVILSAGTDTVESGNIQVNNSLNKAITVNEETYIFGAKSATLKSALGNTLDISRKDFVSTVNASAYKTAVDIVGNTQDNLLKGGTKNDTLSGGEGNDTLTGGKGVDKFIYESGKDVITDYTAGEVINIAGNVTSKTISWTLSKNKKDVIFDLGDDNSIIVKNGKGKFITINDNVKKYTAAGSASTSEYINLPNDTDPTDDTNPTDNTSTRDFVEKTWFADDDNFVSNDINSILKTDSIDYSTEDIINTNNLLSKSINLITLNSNKKSTRNA